MKTKDRILSTALTLFNEQGLAKVVLRTIAKEMNMSQGNLNYHFKKREEIVEALYFQLVKAIDEGLKNHKPGRMGLSALYDLNGIIMSSFYEYRFFMLDFVQIMRENKAIRTHYLQLSEIRKKQFHGLFVELVDKGLMREEELPNEYRFLYERFQILGDFWISSAEVGNGNVTQKMIARYSDVLTQAIYPYLTPKGKKEYHKLSHHR